MQRKLYANIIVDISQERLDRTFSYLVPDSMQNLIHIGDVVAIPFGKGNRLTKGYVVELTGITQYEESKMKSIQEILVGTEQTTGEDRLITLAAWMRDTYGSTMIQALKTVIPIKKKVKPKEKKTKTDGSGKKIRKRAGLTEDLDAASWQLFERLRQLRLTIAGEQKVPPYIVFSDKTLIDMCVKKPTDRASMLEVSGVGEAKYEKYGERFLEELAKK